MDYAKIVERSWKLTWQHKYLWVLGFFAALGSASNGSSGANSNFEFSGSEFSQVPEWMTNFGLLAGIGLFVLIFSLVLWLLATASRGGLISAVARIENGEKPTLGEAFAAGTAKLGSLVGMNLILYGPFILLSFIIGVLAAIVGFSALAMENPGMTPLVDPEPFIASMGILIACISGLLCLLLPVMLVVVFVQPFAFRGIMLQEMGVMDSIRHGWQVLRENVAEILLLGVLFLVISILFSFVVLLALAPVGIVAALPVITSIIAGDGGLGAGMIIYSFFGLVCLGFLGALLTSVVTVWQSSAFTMAYMEFAEKKPLAA